MRPMLILIAGLCALSLGPRTAAQPDIRVAVVGATGSAALDPIRQRIDGLDFVNWWEAAAADAITPFSVIFFDPATLDDAALRWSWHAFQRGVVFVGVGASYAEMRYLTGGLCTARGAQLPATLPGAHAITFYTIPGAEPFATEADLRGCVLPDGASWTSVPVKSEGVLTAPLDDAGLDALLETVEFAMGEGG